MSDNIVTVTPTEFLGFLEEHFKTKRPMFVRGGPGVGKSSIIKQFCDAKKIGYVDLRVLYYDPTDLKGMPHLNVKDRTTEVVRGVVARDAQSILDKMSAWLPTDVPMEAAA